MQLHNFVQRICHKSTYECSDFKDSNCLSLLIHSLAEIQRSIRLTSGTNHNALLMAHNSAILYTWKFSKVQNLAECCFNRNYFSRFLFSCVSLDKVIDHALYITYASQSLLCEESLRNIDLVAKLCVSVSLTGVVFRFEQPVYNISESGFFLEVCILLVMGSLDRQVVVTVQTGSTGTATGRK